LQSRDQYTQNFTNARQGVTGLVNELLRRGVPYEAIGQIPVTGDWTQQTLDAGNRPEEMLARSPRYGEFAREAQGLYSASGLGPYGERFSTGGEAGDWMSGGEVLNPEQQIDRLLSAVLGSSMLAPADVSKASGLMTSMYGGPLWTALARMGVSDPTLQGLMAQNFDPWVIARTPEFQQRAPSPQLPNDLIDTGYQGIHFSPSTGLEYTAAQIQAERAPRPEPPDPGAAGAAYWANLAAQGGPQSIPLGPLNPEIAAYQQQVSDYLAQLDAYYQNALNPQLSLPTVQAPVISAGVPTSVGVPPLTPTTLTGGGLTAEQIEWLRSQGWLA
jgi:hypothetical protein